ncbi:MAG TPA: hypothetical protein VNO30_48810 [Kofleriaceae bacterium]|nr:hypothetical protein [Kofleriaceae bacterium]
MLTNVPSISAASSTRDVYVRLKDEPMADQVGAVARVALSERAPADECPAYLAAVEGAVAAEPPPFGMEVYRSVYRHAAANPTWLILSLVRNAQREGQGATDLWSLAACATDGHEQKLLKRHAVDESRHAKVYLALLDLSFPDAVDPIFRSEMNAFSPDYALAREPRPVAGSLYAKPPTLDDFVQMNIAEIRTTIHHLMQRAALETHCPAANLPRAIKLLNALLRDELSHVAYTAVLIERKAAALGPGELSRLYSRRLRDFNRITTEEMGKSTYD